MKKILFIFMLFSATSAFAQDVIVKKDGSTILSKVLEITATEVKYKKFSNQNGPTYTIAKSEIMVINYENGEKEVFDKTIPAQTRQDTQPQPAQQKVQQQYNIPSDAQNLNAQWTSDRDLLKMAGVDYDKKAKRLKKTGWTVGGILTGVGISLMALPLIVDLEDIKQSGRKTLIISGGICLVSGITTTTICLSQAKRIERQARFSIQSAPVYQYDFTFNNGTSLSTGMDIIRDNRKNNPTLGLGLRYKF